MFTNVFVTPEDAETLFEAFKRKEGDGATVLETFERHFAIYASTHLRDLEAILEIKRGEGYFLNFKTYLPRLPQLLTEMGINPVKVQIVRFNHAPTKARAGWYENPAKGMEALVERVAPAQHTNYRKPIAPLYAQNITVSGPSLKAAQEFNTRLSCGDYHRFLVNAFE